MKMWRIEWTIGSVAMKYEREFANANEKSKNIDRLTMIRKTKLLWIWETDVMKCQWMFDYDKLRTGEYVWYANFQVCGQ